MSYSDVWTLNFRSKNIFMLKGSLFNDLWHIFFSFSIHKQVHFTASDQLDFAIANTKVLAFMVMTYQIYHIKLIALRSSTCPTTFHSIGLHGLMNMLLSLCDLISEKWLWPLEYPFNQCVNLGQV